MQVETTFLVGRQDARNALQPVMYIPYSQDQQQQLNTIRDAVNRIDWALREILPGTPHEDFSPPRHTAA